MQDGSVDASFYAQVQGAYVALLTQHLGGVLAVGQLAVGPYHQTDSYFTARFTDSGALDGSFAKLAPEFGAYQRIVCATVDSFQRIYIGGIFDRMAGYNVTNLARLSPTGQLDTSFHLAEHNSGILALAAVSDGSILVSGDFVDLYGPGQALRMLPDGTIDPLYVRGEGPMRHYPMQHGLFSGFVFAIAPRREGGCFIGGDFEYYLRTRDPRCEAERHWSD
jgi:hypothetical protein